MDGLLVLDGCQLDDDESLHEQLGSEAEVEVETVDVDWHQVLALCSEPVSFESVREDRVGDRLLKAGPIPL